MPSLDELIEDLKQKIPAADTRNRGRYHQPTVVMVEAAQALIEHLTPRNPEVLIVRDPDGDTEATLFLDGREIACVTEVIDPGAGYTRDEWEEITYATSVDQTLSPGFRKRAAEYRNEWSNSEYITD